MSCLSLTPSDSDSRKGVLKKGTSDTTPQIVRFTLSNLSLLLGKKSDVFSTYVGDMGEKRKSLPFTTKMKVRNLNQFKNLLVFSFSEHLFYF